MEEGSYPSTMDLVDVFYAQSTGRLYVFVLMLIWYEEVNIPLNFRNVIWKSFYDVNNDPLFDPFSSKLRSAYQLLDFAGINTHLFLIPPCRHWLTIDAIYLTAYRVRIWHNVESILMRGRYQNTWPRRYSLLGRLRHQAINRGVMVKAMNCGIVVCEFVLQSRYYVHFRANTLGKGMNPLILPPAMGK